MDSTPPNLALKAYDGRVLDGNSSGLLAGSTGVQQPNDEKREFSISPGPLLTIVSFASDDPENPYNWSLGKKLHIVVTAILLTVNSTISSAITSNSVSYIMAEFDVKDDIQVYLPVSVYLIGYIFGPLVFSPLSETVGRKMVVFWTFNVFIIFTLACALSPNWPSFLVFRLVTGTCASVPLTVIGGLFADIFQDPQTRGRAMVAFMSGTTFGPLGGPMISGYLSPVGWRWNFWLTLILAGCSWVPLSFVPETFSPAILKSRARKLRKATGNEKIKAPIELQVHNRSDFIIKSLIRPVEMLCLEPLVYLNCLYIALLYAFFYFFFQAYPIIFQGVYGFSKGECGLALIPIGIGAALTAPVLLYYDSVYERARKKGMLWAMREEYHRLPIACLGSPFCVVSLFWLGWGAQPGIHWMVPCLSGLFFGFGYLLIFTALSNYLVDAYEIFAASAMAASCFSRSIVGACLPLAAKPLYQSLGIQWATSLLGFLSLVLVPIPFALTYYGPRVRAKSKFCQYLLEQKNEQHSGIEIQVRQMGT